LIGSASAAESRSSRRLSTEVYLTRIQTRKGPPPLSQAILSLSLSLSLSLAFLVSISLSLLLSRRSLRSRSIRSEVRPRALRRVHSLLLLVSSTQPPTSRSRMPLAFASEAASYDRVDIRAKGRSRRSLDFLLFRSRILRSRDTRVGQCLN